MPPCAAPPRALVIAHAVTCRCMWDGVRGAALAPETELGPPLLPGCRLQLEQPLTDHARLQAADLQLLTVRQHRHVRTARHHIDLDDAVNVGKRAASKPDE